MIEIHLQQDLQARPQAINGFAKAMRGSRISYHSHHPEAESGLIVRANATQNNIAWRTDRLPANQDQHFSLLLLCGIAGSKGGQHVFELSANGMPLGSIQTASVDHLPHCKPAEGINLSFKQLLSDQFGDRFGILSIALPPNLFPDKDIIDLELSSQNDSSEDWIIVFDYPFAFRPRVCAEPILKQVDDKPGQILRVIWDQFATGSTLSIKTPLEHIDCQKPSDGANIFRIAVPAVSCEQEIKISYYHNNLPNGQESLILSPVTPRRAHILPFSHNDIGYTDLQETVRLKQQLNIDLALERIDQTAHLDQDARPTWNLEVLWALESWWNVATNQQKDKFAQAVQDGHIGLNALHNNLLSGLCNQPELHHHLDLARQIAQDTGISIDTAAVTDIPGFVWSLVEALATAGVRYLSIAPNNGDRVGQIYDLADQPFWWASPDGSHKLLTWIFGAGYAMFHRESITGTGLKKALDYLDRLEQSWYPYPLVPLAYTIGGDNGGFDEALPEWVQAWNREYSSPRFIVSTHARFYEEFSALELELPVLKGDMTPYWEDGAASTARETKLARNAADRLLLVEELYRQHFPEQTPTQEIHSAWQQVIFWDEHTWGAWNSVSEPDDPVVIGQWNYKQRFAFEADRLSHDLLKSLQDKGIAIPQTGFPDDFYPTHQDLILPPELPSSLENDWIALNLDPATCSVSSLILKPSLSSPLPQSHNFFQYLYMQGSDRDRLQSVANGKITGYTKADGYQQLIMSGTAPGCSDYHLAIRIPDARPELEIAVCLDKLPVRAKESVHIAFPFALDGGRLYYDGAGTWIDPARDLLPVACRNFFCPQRRVKLSSPQATLTITLKDNPLIEIGRVTAEEPWLRSLPPSTQFYAYLMNNYWHTNYKADQSGRSSYRFSIRLET